MSGSAPGANGFEGVVRHSAIYAVARILISGLDLFLLPVYTRVLTPEAYGLVAISVSILAVLAIVYPLGLEAALGRFFFDHEPDTVSHRRAVATIVVGAAASGLVVGLLLSALGPRAFGDLLAGMPPTFFVILVWTAFLNLFMQVGLYLLQIRREPWRYLALALGQAGLRGPLTLVLVVGMGGGAMGWAQAYFATGLVGAIISILYLRHTVTMAAGIDANLLRNAFKYGLPLLVHQLAGWTSVYASRLILNQLASLSAVGTFQVAFGIGQGLGLITTAVNFAYAPFFMAAAARSTEETAYRSGWFSTYYLAGIVAVAVGVSLFAKEVTLIAASSAFTAAVPLVPIILAASVLQGSYYLLANPIYFRKSLTRYLPLVTVIGGIVSVGASYVLIPYLGVVGAAWAALLANLAMVCAAYPLSQKALRIRYEYWRIGILVTSGSSVVIISRCLATLRLPEAVPWLANVGLFGLYLTTLVGLKILTKELLHRVASLLPLDRRPFGPHAS